MRFLFVVLLLWSFTAFACPGDAGEPLPPRDRLEQAEAELAALAARCGDNPGYLAYYGAVLNALGKPAQAAGYLEQALMFDPDRAGAQIDYAESLAALGDTAAAASLLKQLLERADVPPLLRPHLERRLNALEAVQRTDWLSALRSAGEGWRGIGSVTVRAGRESNLNSAPSRSTLTFTLPGAEAVLLLAESFRRRSGNAAIVEASGQLVRPIDGRSALHVFGESRARASTDQSDTNYQQLQVIGAYSRLLDSGEALVSVGSSHLQYGGDYLYQATRLAVARDWERPQCRPRLGVETETRRYPAASVLDGQLYGASTGLACQMGPNRLTLTLRVAQDFERSSRPGGDQRLADLRAVWVGPLGPGSVLADVILSRQDDTSGYSPLLANNAVRHIDRATVRLEYAHPLSSVWSLVGSVEATTQRSNLELFDITGRAVYLGLRWQSRR